MVSISSALSNRRSEERKSDSTPPGEDTLQPAGQCTYVETAQHTFPGISALCLQQELLYFD